MAKAANGNGARLAAEQLDEVLRLSKRADSVELKLIVPMAAQRDALRVLRKLGLDPVEAQPRQVFFFDTPGLELSKAGVVVRARRIQGGTADTVVKLRPVEPDDLDKDLRRSGAFKVEVDVVPGGFVCSGSLRGQCSGKEVLEALAEGGSLRSIFSKEQRAFYKAHAPKDIKLDSLTVFGPTFVLKSKVRPKDFDERALTVELWLYPDGTRNLEISTKCTPDVAIQEGNELRAYLSNNGIQIAGGQTTKTKAAMDYFVGEMKAGRKRVEHRN
ncbi:MAG: adenylate cyclase [Myxococcota bacterium]